MNDLSDAQKQVIFGRKTMDEKVSDFSSSVAVDLLRQFGYPGTEIELWQRKAGPEFTVENVAAQLGVPFAVHATRVASFSFEQLFAAKTVHPLTKEYLRLVTDGDAHVVYRAYGLGRVVLSTMPRLPQEKTAVLSVLAGTREIYVHHFKGFFALAHPDLIGATRGQE